VQWPVRRAGAASEQRFFANGGFSTPDRRARLIPVSVPAPREPAHPDALVLNTGRVRDHWHTMTRTGRSARLSAHVAEPCAELHPRDAQRRGIADGDLVRLHNAAGELLLRARIVPAQRAGSVFVPMHWSDAFASRARVNTLVAAHTDPVSGQPALKQASVLAQRVAASWHAFAVTRLRPAPTLLDAIAPYWCLAPCASGWRVELAGIDACAHWDAHARALFGTPANEDLLAYRDAVSGDHRFAAFSQDTLSGALFVARTPIRVSRDWLADVLDAPHADPRARFRIIAGRPGGERADPGPMVCVCNGVGLHQIVAAIGAGGCCSVDEVGAAVNAGTGCGSCRAEIAAILNAQHADAAE
jgi:assimilatory nitrate reductase catalytic subunit